MSESAEQVQDQGEFDISPDLLDILIESESSRFSAQQIEAIKRGEGGVKGCVTKLNYNFYGTLQIVEITEPSGISVLLGPTLEDGPGKMKANNLPLLKAQFEQAANYGHGLVAHMFAGTIVILWSFPCRCLCK